MNKIQLCTAINIKNYMLLILKNVLEILKKNIKKEMVNVLETETSLGDILCFIPAVLVQL